MCTSSTPTVESYKVAKPAATPPSPTESPTAPEATDTTTATKKKSTMKGKLALRSNLNTPSGLGLNTF